METRQSARCKDWRRRNAERVRAYDLARKARQHDNHLRRKYGITAKDRARVAAQQRHRCAGCRKPRRLVVDHCHKTNDVRGLLCNGCNTALGLVMDNPATLLRLAGYIEKSRGQKTHRKPAP